MNKLRVVNLALSALGETEVTDLVTGLGNAGRKVMAQIEQARETVLECHGWLCALEYTALTVKDGDNANFKYAYVYELPEDALRVWEVDGECYGWEAGTATDGDGASRQIVRSNDAGPLELSYVRRAAWEALPPSLADAVALTAAARACGPISSDNKDAARLEKAAGVAMAKARSAESLQVGNETERDASPFAALRAAAG